jgi:hypothetical protein
LLLSFGPQELLQLATPILHTLPDDIAAYLSRFRNSGNVEILLEFAQPPLRFENITGTKFHRLVTPDKMKYAAYAPKTEIAQ